VSLTDLYERWFHCGWQWGERFPMTTTALGGGGFLKFYTSKYLFRNINFGSHFYTSKDNYGILKI